VGVVDTACGFVNCNGVDGVDDGDLNGLFSVDGDDSCRSSTLVIFGGVDCWRDGDLGRDMDGEDLGREFGGGGSDGWPNCCRCKSIFRAM